MAHIGLQHTVGRRVLTPSLAQERPRYDNFWPRYDQKPSWGESCTGAEKSHFHCCAIWFGFLRLVSWENGVQVHLKIQVFLVSSLTTLLEIEHAKTQYSCLPLTLKWCTKKFTNSPVFLPTSDPQGYPQESSTPSILGPSPFSTYIVDFVNFGPIAVFNLVHH